MSVLPSAWLTRSAAAASITMALVLALLKGWATWRTGSTAMLGSLADTALDLVASVATLIGVWIAAMPADEEHRFGHGKAEALAAMLQVILIALSASGIAFRAAMRLVEGGRVEAADEGMAVSAIAIVATFALLAWQRHVIRRTGSLAIRTDSVHYQSDLFLNLAVIAALAIDQYLGFTKADPLFGLGIAGWLVWGAWRASREAVDSLMDREWPEEKRLRFVEHAARHSELSKLHDLRTRTSGHRDFAQFHVDLAPGMTIAEAHTIVERVEADLCRAFPGLELLIHIDPEGHVDEPGNVLVESDEFAKLESKAMSRAVPYWHVDAFAERPFAGNQAAVMQLDAWLADGVLQAIGEENNFAETAFVVPDTTGAADWELRWFTPACEVRLCGHATLASGHVLLEKSGRDRVTFRTRRAGVLTVRRMPGGGYELALPAIPTSPGEWPEAAVLLAAEPAEVWRSPDGYNVFLFDSESQVRALAPDLRGLSRLGDEQFICTAPGMKTDVVSRVFVPGGGVDEDSVTGSAHAALTPFWATRLGRNRFTAHQASSRGGDLTCRLDGEHAWLGGHCVTVVEGTFYLSG